MTGGPTIGRCAECEELAGLVRYEGRLVCPRCKFADRHPEEPPLYRP